jgi:hypothetical protein
MDKQKVNQALQARLAESRQRIIDAIHNNPTNPETAVDHELRMLMAFSERLLQLGAQTPQEVPHARHSL